jgi:hypothetical protein
MNVCQFENPMDNEEDLRALINSLLDQDARNIPRALKRRALDETCQYIEEHMAFVDGSFADRFELLKAALDQVSLAGGLWLEFGVYKGSTISFIAQRTQGVVYGFDSFQGNPENWRGMFRQGCFALPELPEYPPNVEIVAGWFADRLPGFLAAHPGPAAFIHIDCDLYSSTKSIFDACRERIRAGTVLVFDEYFNYPGWKNHEFKAFMEFIEQDRRSFEYLGYVYKHSQAAVKITG